MSAGADIVNAISDSTDQITETVSSSTNLIGGKLNNLLIANVFGTALTTGAIAVSTGLMVKRLDSINNSIERLGAQFSEGMALLISQIDIQNKGLVSIQEKLENIHETIKSPTLTQATEWRNIGIERMGDGLIPEAIDAFGKAIDLNIADPVSNYMLGKLYLDGVDEENNFHDPEQAISFFQKSARYASSIMNRIPEMEAIHYDSLFLAALALLAKANRTKIEKKSNILSSDDVGNAFEILNRLLRNKPDHSQGIYLKTKLLVFQHKIDEFKSEFERLVEVDPDYLFVAINDEDLKINSDQCITFLKEFEGKYRNWLRSEINDLLKHIHILQIFNVELPSEVQEWIKLNIPDVDNSMMLLGRMNFIDLVSHTHHWLPLLRVVNKEIRSTIIECKEDYKSRITKAAQKIDWKYFNYYCRGRAGSINGDTLNSSISTVISSSTDGYSIESIRNIVSIENDINKLNVYIDKMKLTPYHHINCPQCENNEAILKENSKKKINIRILICDIICSQVAIHLHADNVIILLRLLI